MSVTVKFYNFVKNENSTARPSGSANWELTCVIRKDCSIINPQLELDYDPSNGSAIFNNNYCYIANFHRYYYVRDWTISDSFVIATLEVDVLATYRTQIGSSTLFVVRSSAHVEGGLVDNFYPTTSRVTFDASFVTNPWIYNGSGTYIIGVVSKTGTYGSVEYYALTYSNMAALVQNLLNDSITNSNGFSWDDASQALQKSIIDPLQFIKSCVYLPIAYSDIAGSSVSSIDIFDWSINCTAKKPTYTLVIQRNTFDIPRHPDSGVYEYLNFAPYSTYTINIPPFGLIELDSTALAASNNVITLVVIDIPTGEGTLEIYTGDLPGSGPGAYVSNILRTQVGVPVQLSQVNKNYLGAAGNILGAIGNALSGNILGAAAGVGSTVQSLAPRSNTIGTQGAFSSLYAPQEWGLYAQFMYQTARDVAHHGGCTMRNLQINTISGYILVEDGDIEMNGTLEEKRRVKEYLESGFYYE